MKQTFFLSPHLLVGMLIFFTLGCFAQPLGAQSSNQEKGTVVEGKVIDTNNEALIGVAIRIAGTDKGTVTDFDGNFKITVPNTNSRIRFTYIGFVTQEVNVDTKKAMTITLLEDNQQLEEIVVVGYGVQKKSHLTGSITKVNTQGLEDIPVSRLDQALQGRIAGVQIQNTTSEVGEMPQVRVRGMGSISAAGEPLVIIDGFPVEDGLGLLNMSDVESIEVLKDAASAAIYGSRAANGVIIVTTKSGVPDKPKYTLKASWGTKSAYKLHPIMTSKEYTNMLVNEYNLRGDTGKYPVNDFAYSTIDNNTDWQKIGTQTANMYNVQLGVSGGKKDLKYYISGNYVSDEGIMLNNKFDRMNIRAKVDVNLSKRVSMGINLAPTYAKRERPSTNFIDFYRSPSWLPVRHTAQTAALTGYEEGSYANGAHFNNVMYKGKDPVTGEEREEKGSPFNTKNHNPKMIMDNESRMQKDYKLQASAYVNIKILNDLIFSTSNGFNYSYSDKDNYRNFEAKQDGERNRGLYQNDYKLDLLSENTLNYTKKFNGKHDFNALLGFSAQRIDYRRSGILGYDFPTDQIHTINAAGEIAQFEGGTHYTGTWKSDEGMLSVFSRFTYSFEDRYLASVSVRTDGSSKFGSDNQWGWFPSASVGWRISEEKFIKENLSWLSNAKARASFGVTGTKEIENYANTTILAKASYPLGEGNGNVHSGLAPDGKKQGNNKLKWEQTNEFNFGLDLSFLNNRIGMTLDYYYSTTKSLLFLKDISPVTGYLQKWTNQGKIRNKGVEFELSTVNFQTKDFTWNTSFNIATNSNKILDLGGAPFLLTKGERNELYMTRVGDPSVQFYGFKTIGIWNSKEEIANNASHNSDKEGGLRVQNTNGDGVINDDDRVALGSPFPDFTWGLNNSLTYKDFDLSFLLQGVEGIKVWNGDDYYNETRKWNKNYVKNRWVSPEHPGDGKTPYFNNGIDHMQTDHAIQDASYIALRDVTVGYQIPKKLLKKTIFSKVRVYASAQNLGYWFTGDYKGINPEARMNNGAYSSPLVSGYQRGAFPLQRTFSFGIDINF